MARSRVMQFKHKKKEDRGDHIFSAGGRQRKGGAGGRKGG